MLTLQKILKYTTEDQLRKLQKVQKVYSCQNDRQG